MEITVKLILFCNFLKFVVIEFVKTYWKYHWNLDNEEDEGSDTSSIQDDDRSSDAGGRARK